MIHKHKCKNDSCAEVWEHDNRDSEHDEKLYEDSHNCPKCGINQRAKLLEFADEYEEAEFKLTSYYEHQQDVIRKAKHIGMPLELALMMDRLFSD